MSSTIAIDNILPYTQSTATAGQTVFDTNWTADVADDVLVYARAAGVAANDFSQLVSDIDYNVTFIGGSETVRVTFLAGRTVGDVITIIRLTPADRLNLYTNSNFVPSMLNGDFGRTVMQIQQNETLRQLIGPHYNISETVELPDNDGGQDLILPILAAGQIWRKHSSGNYIEAVDVPDAIEVGGSTGSVQWNNGGNLDGDLLFTYDGAGNVSIIGSLQVDNININGNTISSTDTNGDINLVPDGTGIVSVPTPTEDESATTKAYVDALAAGFHYFQPTRVATTANFASTYNNVDSGVGATLTANANGAANIDGVALVLNDRVLFKNQTNQFENGIYVVSQVGDGSTPAIYTRSTDFDEPDEIAPGDVVVVLEGTVNAVTKWLQTATVTTIGVDSIVWALSSNNPNDVMTLSGTQTATGSKTFDAFSGTLDANLDTAGNSIESSTGVITFADDYNAPNKISKNLIIGGDFSLNPWQRGTSIPITVSGQYAADRFKLNYAGTTGTVTISKSADAPTVAQANYLTQHSMLVTVTAADAAVAAGDLLYVTQILEGYNFSTIAQRVFTISFWVKSSLPGTYCVFFQNLTGSRSWVSEYVVNAANTWEYKTITVDATPSSGTWNYENGIGMYVGFTLMSGTTFQTTPNAWQTGSFSSTSNQVNFMGTNGNTFRLSLVQIEAGAAATPFEPRTRQEELALCQRYFVKTFNQGVTPAQNTGSQIGALVYRASNAGVSGSGTYWEYPETMRTTLIGLTTYSTNAASANWYNLTAGAPSGVPTAIGSSQRGLFVSNPQVAGDTVASQIFLHAAVTAEL